MGLLHVGKYMAIISVGQEKFIGKCKSKLNSLLPESVLYSLPFALIRNWVFQGVVLSHWSEIIFRAFLELLLFLVVWLVFYGLLGLPSSWLFAFLLAHTLMWIFNGHFWALHIGQKKRLVSNDPKRIIDYLYGLENRLRKADAINGCILFGSLTYGQFHEFSDLDIVITKKSGLFNSVRAYFIGVMERALAFVSKIPIELSFLDPKDFVMLNEGEIPLLIKDENDQWRKIVKNAIWLNEYPFEKMIFFKDKI